MKKSELQTMVLTELKALAKKMKVSIPARSRKSDIVSALLAAFDQKSGKAAVVKNNGTTKSAIAKKRPIAKKETGAKRQPVSKRKPPEQEVKTPATGREWQMPPGTEEPLMAQERVSEAKYYTGPEKEQREQNYPYVELPLGYGEEKISLMVRDPFLAYTYWEVTQSRLQREKEWFGWNGKLTIRVYDVTGIEFNGRNAIGYFDQEVDQLIGSWYFDLGRPTHSFIADIGLLSPDGRFLTLARSNFVLMPRDGVSDVVDEEWLLVDEEFWKLYGFPGGPSSPHLQEMMKQRRMQEITSPGTFSRMRSKRK